MIQKWLAGLVAAAFLAGCATTVVPPRVPVQPGEIPAATSPEQAAKNFVQVVDRVVPVAEAICLQRTRNVPCAFQIAIDDRPGQPPNAFQTLDDQGNPVIAFTVSLLLDVRNPDELAFVMGHEAAHHIAGHIARQQDEMIQGALVAGTLATLGGGDEAAIRAAQDMGAQLGARRYSKDFELEADALGTEIAWRAGFDPVVGAQFFAAFPIPATASWAATLPMPSGSRRWRGPCNICVDPNLICIKDAGRAPPAPSSHQREGSA